jgi:hypothetical protein
MVTNVKKTADKKMTMDLRGVLRSVFVAPIMLKASSQSIWLTISAFEVPDNSVQSTLSTGLGGLIWDGIRINEARHDGPVGYFRIFLSSTYQAGD